MKPNIFLALSLSLGLILAYPEGHDALTSTKSYYFPTSLQVIPITDEPEPSHTSSPTTTPSHTTSSSIIPAISSHSPSSPISSIPMPSPSPLFVNASSNLLPCHGPVNDGKPGGLSAYCAQTRQVTYYNLSALPGTRYLDVKGMDETTGRCKVVNRTVEGLLGPFDEPVSCLPTLLVSLFTALRKSQRDMGWVRERS